MATPRVRAMASPSSQKCCCALAAPPLPLLVGASLLAPRSALPVLARPRVEKAARVASAPRAVQGREAREGPERSRSLHRRRRGGGVVVVVAAAASSSSSSSSKSETEKAATTKKRSRSRSRKRLLPSLEDLRPQRGEGEHGNGGSTTTALLSSSSASVSPSSSSSSSTPGSSSSSNTNNANGSVLSAVALIVGSSVGAGVLALPAVSAPAGLAPSAAALVGVWALLTAEALLIAEVNLSLLGAKKRERRLKRSGRSGRRSGGSKPGEERDFSEDDEDEDEDAIVTLREMAHETLGERGGHFVAAAYLALSYSLMVAYISKAGELVSSALDPLLSSGASAVSAAASSTAASTPLLSVSPGTGAALFTAAMGLTLFGGAAAVDKANRAMTLSLLAAYAVIVAVGGAQAEWGALAERAPDWGAAPAAVPVILLSLVYHDLVPVVCAQLRGDAAKVRTALFVGSAAPLAMFILWDAVALALVGGGSPNNNLGEALSSSSSTFVDPLETLISSGGGAVGAAIGAFSLLAIVTSCLGTALGLSSTLTAEIKGLVAAAGARGEEKVKEAAEAAAAAAAAAKAAAAKSSRNPLLRALSTTLASFSEDDSSSEEEDEEDEKEGELASMLSTAATTTAIRVAAFALVLGPPLAASLANPGSFFGVLNAVGGYGMTALYGVLPPLMAWKLREQQEKEKEEKEGEGGGKEATAAATTAKAPKQQRQQQELAPSPSSFSPPLLPGGRAALTALTTASVAVEVGRLADDLEGWRRAASEAVAGAGADAAAAASSTSSSSFAAASAISTAFEGFLAGSDAGEKFSSSVVAHVSELLAAILP